MTLNPIAFASSIRDKQSRKVELRSTRPSAERGKNSYHAAIWATGRSTTTRGGGAYCVARERSGYVAISTSSAPDSAIALISAFSAAPICCESWSNLAESAGSCARCEAALSNAAPSSASLVSLETRASNFATNSRCQLRNVSVQASTVYS